LVDAAVAVSDVELGAVGGGAGADDVEALAVDLEGVAADGPLLCAGRLTQSDRGGAPGPRNGGAGPGAR
jgi:hypothetical protein